MVRDQTIFKCLHLSPITQYQALQNASFTHSHGLLKEERKITLVVVSLFYLSKSSMRATILLEGSVSQDLGG